MLHASRRLLLVTTFLLTGLSHAQAAQPPAEFNDLGVTMQSRVCGELLTGLSLGGVQAIKMKEANGGKVAPVQRTAVYETGARAVVLLSMAGSLKLDERLKAGEVANTIEKLDPAVHVATALFCNRRIEAWIRGGQVAPDFLSQAYGQSKSLLDSAFAGELATPNQ